MLDSVLAWLVVIAPTLFAFGIELMSEEMRKSKTWRIVVIALGLSLSGVTYWQQARERTDGQAREKQLKQDLHSDLQGQLDQQKKDLISAFAAEAKTPAERAFVQRVTPVAIMDFGFADDATGGYKDTISVSAPYATGSFPFPRKLVSFKLAGSAVGKLAAKSAHIWVRACSGCNWVTVPDGFKQPYFGPNVSTDVDKLWGDVPAGPVIFLGDFQMFLPLGRNEAPINVGIGYTCDNCAPADAEHQKKLTLKIN